MAEEESYDDEIQIIAEKLTSTTTIESAFNPVQRKGRTFRTVDRSNNGTMTYDDPSEGNKSNITATSTSAATVDGNSLLNIDAEATVNLNASVEIDADDGNDHRIVANADIGTDVNVTLDNSMIRNLPELNVPEKILLVIDTVREDNDTQFKFGAGTTYPSLTMIKRAIEMFISAKNTIQRRHEFAIMTMDSKDSQWVCDFTASVKTILTKLNAITESVSEDKHKTYDLGPLFEKIQAKIPLSENNDPAIVTFTARVILVYTRSNCMPKFHMGRKYLKKLMENPYFFLDVLYIHESPSKENMCEDIYNKIASLEMSNFSYIMEVGRNAARLHEAMAKMLAHPLQRPPQIEALYTLSASAAISQQVHTDV